LSATAQGTRSTGEGSRSAHYRCAETARAFVMANADGGGELPHLPAEHRVRPRPRADAPRAPEPRAESGMRAWMILQLMRRTPKRSQLPTSSLARVRPCSVSRRAGGGRLRRAGREVQVRMPFSEPASRRRTSSRRSPGAHDLGPLGVRGPAGDERLGDLLVEVHAVRDDGGLVHVVVQRFSFLSALPRRLVARPS
jgi:hypothetical protein